jgi:membrane associated rhomboid family serine protease
MFWFLPIGVEKAEVDRVPWISIAIAALCVAAFVATWVVPDDPEGAGSTELYAALEYWSEHPYLEAPEGASQVVGAKLREFIEKQRADYLAENGDAPATAPEEQEELGRRIAAFLAAADSSPLRRFSLVPARGFAQIGWLTSLFLHFGWMHLLGNLLFFYIVGPLLEDLWGRPLFLGFYLVSGVIASAAQFALDPHSAAMNLGASGAIAGCMGAFTCRCATRRIRIAYFAWIFYRIARGIFTIPAWLWGALWFGSEVWSFTTGGEPGVAVMAHIGGFAFGFAVALGLKFSGIEARYVAPAVGEKIGGWEQSPQVVAALEALGRRDEEGARAAYAKALDAQPDCLDALTGLVGLESKNGRASAAGPYIERFLVRALAKPDPQPAFTALEQLGSAFEPSALRPNVAFRLASALEKGPEHLRSLRGPLYSVAGAVPGALGAKALIRAAELCLEGREDRKAAMDYLRRAAASPGLPPELATRIAGLQARIEPREVAEAPQPQSQPRSQPQSRRPQVFACRLLAVDQRGLLLESGGQQRLVPMDQVAAIGVGIVDSSGGQPKPRLLTDLVLRSNAGPLVLRMPAEAMGLERLYPGAQPRQAHAQLMAFLLQSSGAAALPAAQAVCGQWQRFADEAAFEQALYRPTA